MKENTQINSNYYKIDVGGYTKKKMIVITGAAGHLGNVLVRELLGKGKKIRAVLLPGEDSTSLQGLDIEKVEADIRFPASLKKALEGAEIVIHCAGVISILSGQKAQLFQVNVLGTKNIVDICLEKKIKRLVYVSSLHAFSEPEKGITINELRPFDPENISGDYSKSKSLASLEVLKGIKQGLDAVIVCPSGIIGPYDYRLSEMGKLISDFSQGKIKAYIEGSYDFVDVRDVAKGIVLACEKGVKGESYILSGEQISVKEILEYLEEISGIKGPSVKIPFHIARMFGLLNSFYCRIVKSQPLFTPFSLDVLASNSLVTSQKAQDSLGYTFRPIRESIKDTFQWFKEQEMI